MRSRKPQRRSPAEIISDHTPEEYMAKVETVREGMRQGDYYEVVLRQTFSAPFSGKPVRAVSSASRRPAPALTNFCCNSATSNWSALRPRCSCAWKAIASRPAPSAGTARRTGDPLRDAESIRELLNSTKEESELTMCTRRRPQR